MKSEHCLKGLTKTVGPLCNTSNVAFFITLSVAMKKHSISVLAFRSHSSIVVVKRKSTKISFISG